MTIQITTAAVPNEVSEKLDSDPQEIAEWLEALDDVIRFDGADRCRELLSRLTERARCGGIACETLLNVWSAV